jgi:hypothetical protein
MLAAARAEAANPVVRLLERLWAPIALRQDGDHVLRDPVDRLASAGFAIETLERLVWGSSSASRPSGSADRPGAARLRRRTAVSRSLARRRTSRQVDMTGGGDRR